MQLICDWSLAQREQCKGTWESLSVNFGLQTQLMVFVFYKCQQELIQNADDAQATEVVFIHDERSYGTESLWSDELGEYQGMQDIQRIVMFYGHYQH